MEEWRSPVEMEEPDTNISAEGRSCHRSEEYKQIHLSLTYSIIFVLGLPLNGAGLWLSWRQAKRWSCATIYLVNLMAAGLLYMSTLPFLIATYSLGDTWPFGGYSASWCASCSTPTSPAA